MTKFDSLLAALEGNDSVPLAQLPKGLHARIRKELMPWIGSWDGLSADQKKTLAFQRDVRNHPDNQEDHELVFNIVEEILELEKQATKTYEGEKQKKRELAELNNRVKRISERMTERVLGTVASKETSRLATEWMVGELSRRRGQGEDIRRPAMLIALGSEFPDLGKQAGRRLFTGLPKEVKAKRGRRKGWRKKGPR